jgi:hypothetical protein
MTVAGSETCYLGSMDAIPLDQDLDRRRIGPFWIEEGTASLVILALVLGAVAALYVLAALNNHPG